MMRLESFIKEIEKHFELKTPLSQAEGGVWLLPVDEAFFIAISEMGDDFIFESTFGALPKEKREELFLDLLHANLFGQGTHGGVLSIDEKREQIHLRKTVLRENSFERLMEELDDFIEVVDFWKGELVT